MSAASNYRFFPQMFNDARNDIANNWDFSALKNFRITERVRFQVRAEAFNVLNRANFFVGVFPGSANINSTSFGRVSSTFGPRIMQFVGRIEF